MPVLSINPKKTSFSHFYLACSTLFIIFAKNDRTTGKSNQEVKMKDYIKEYFFSKGNSQIADDYLSFCDWIHDKREYSEIITSGVFANLDFKKFLAKKIVSDMVNKGIHHHNIIDARLRSLVTYYLCVKIFSQDEKIAESALMAYNHITSSHGHLPGTCVFLPPEKAIVSMRSGDDLYRGYRFFIINMLCFTSRHFVVGMRTDSGPVRGGMKYHKGCRPLGVRKASNGIEWNLIECDYSLSDDNMAVLSNLLDGEGTVEVCDWISNDHQRVIFRCNY